MSGQLSFGIGDFLASGPAPALEKLCMQPLKRNIARVVDAAIGELPDPRPTDARLLGDQCPSAPVALKSCPNVCVESEFHDSSLAKM